MQEQLEEWCIMDDSCDVASYDVGDSHDRDFTDTEFY